MDVWFLGGMILLVWLGAIVFVVRDTWQGGQGYGLDDGQSRERS